jgi:hypothetical protein
MHHQGLADEAIAQRLTAQGYRSPLDQTQLLTNTVRGIRLKHRVFVTRSQSHPRRMAGYLTIPQAAAALGTSPYWGYDRSKKGVIGSSRDQSTGLYLLPDAPETLNQFRDLQAGQINRLSFESRSDNESQTKNRAPIRTKRDKMR